MTKILTYIICMLTLVPFFCYLNSNLHKVKLQNSKIFTAFYIFALSGVSWIFTFPKSYLQNLVHLTEKLSSPSRKLVALETRYLLMWTCWWWRKCSTWKPIFHLVKWKIISRNSLPMLRCQCMKTSWMKCVEWR